MPLEASAIVLSRPSGVSEQFRPMYQLRLRPLAGRGLSVGYRQGERYAVHPAHRFAELDALHCVFLPLSWRHLKPALSGPARPGPGSVARAVGLRDWHWANAARTILAVARSASCSLTPLLSH